MGRGGKEGREGREEWEGEIIVIADMNESKDEMCLFSRQL